MDYGVSYCIFLVVFFSVCWMFLFCFALSFLCLFYVYSVCNITLDGAWSSSHSSLNTFAYLQIPGNFPLGLSPPFLGKLAWMGGLCDDSMPWVRVTSRMHSSVKYFMSQWGAVSYREPEVQFLQPKHGRGIWGRENMGVGQILQTSFGHVDDVCSHFTSLPVLQSTLALCCLPEEFFHLAVILWQCFASVL